MKRRGGMGCRRGKLSANVKRRYSLWWILPPHLEQLEDRTLLTTLGIEEYDQVSSKWFESLTPEVGDLTTYGATNGDLRQQDDSRSSDRWIVRLTPQGTQAAGSVAGAAGLLESQAVGLSVLRGLGLPGQLLVTSTQDATSVEAYLRANPLIASFESDQKVTTQLFPNDTVNWGQYTSQWGLHNVGQSGGTMDADIDAPEAWDLTTGSSQVIVAVLDTGIDYSHPDLAPNMWINPGEIAGNGVDDDDNGFVDDVYGYDFYNGDSDPMDDHRHGTHVAGIIAAAGNNDQGVTGVSWSTKLMALKILDDSNQGQGDLAAAIAALNYLTDMRARGENVRVANNSWGYLGESSKAMRQAIEAAGDAGILFVAAAGNGDAFGRGIDLDAEDDYGFYPAIEDVDSIISVAATDFRDQLTRFSNYGLSSVDIAAPGAGILSTEPDGTYQSRYGTSMAAPHVSGVAALVWSRVPEATVDEVREAIQYGADPTTELQDQLRWGARLNAYGALTVDTAAPRATLDTAPDVTGPGGTDVLITVTYTDNRLVDVDSLTAGNLVVTRLWDGQEMASITVVSKPSARHRHCHCGLPRAGPQRHLGHAGRRRLPNHVGVRRGLRHQLQSCAVNRAGYVQHRYHTGVDSRRRDQ